MLSAKQTAMNHPVNQPNLEHLQITFVQTADITFPLIFVNSRR